MSDYEPSTRTTLIVLVVVVLLGYFGCVVHKERSERKMKMARSLIEAALPTGINSSTDVLDSTLLTATNIGKRFNRKFGPKYFCIQATEIGLKAIQQSETNTRFESKPTSERQDLEYTFFDNSVSMFVGNQLVFFDPDDLAADYEHASTLVLFRAHQVSGGSTHLPGYRTRFYEKLEWYVTFVDISSRTVSPSVRLAALAQNGWSLDPSEVIRIVGLIKR